MRLFKGHQSSPLIPDPKMLGRAHKTDTSQLLIWMDNTIMGLGQAFDRWRYRGELPLDVELSLKALVAIWSELESRGLTKD